MKCQKTPMNLHIDIREGDFDVGQEQKLLSVESTHSGGQVLFIGLVRNYTNNNDSSVYALELPHYKGMTEKTIEEICLQARQRWPLDTVRVIHRVGKLKSQEQIVLVAVSAPHRAEAFQGAEFIMDELKTNATFWKKEIRSDGEHWLDMKKSDIERSEKWQSGS